MSYKALYRKYRPHSFDQVLGQDHVIITLKNIISDQKISHAYLFAGPRGTGKTSVAHVFAQEVNRKQSGSIEVGDLDIIEIDAASNNGVVEIRNIIEGSKYAPTRSQYKVYIIDEVHMLTKGAFNALLKTLEEPPQRVIFILATTEPHKIPITVLSRTQRFNFRRISDQVIIEQLMRVLKQEKITFEAEALKFIAKLAQGGMRDALSIADQAAAYGNYNISFANIAQVFGIVAVANQIKLLNLAFAKQTKQLITLIHDLIDHGIDLERLVFSLIDILKDYIFYQKIHDQSVLEILEEDDLAQFKINVDFAYLCVDKLVALSGQMRFSTIPRQLFELTILQLASKSETGDDVSSQPVQPVKPIKHVVTPPQKVSLPRAQVQTDTSSLPDPASADGFANFLASSKQSKLDPSRKSSPSDRSQIAQDDNDQAQTWDLDQPPQGSPTTASRHKNKATDQYHSDDINLVNQEISQDIENIAVTQELDDDLLSTQDMALTSETNQSKVDLTAILDLPTEQPKSSSTHAQTGPTVLEVINLLLHAERAKLDKFKNKLADIAMFTSEAPDPTYVTLLQDVKFISGGTMFLLVSSENDSVINQINALSATQKFIDFIFHVFGEPLLVYAITKDMFIKVKSKWADLNDRNAVPNKKPLKTVTPSQAEKTEAQKLGEDLFGDLFS